MLSCAATSFTYRYDYIRCRAHFIHCVHSNPRYTKRHSDCLLVSHIFRLLPIYILHFDKHFIDCAIDCGNISGALNDSCPTIITSNSRNTQILDHKLHNSSNMSTSFTKHTTQAEQGIISINDVMATLLSFREDFSSSIKAQTEAQAKQFNSLRNVEMTLRVCLVLLLNLKRKIQHYVLKSMFSSKKSRNSSNSYRQITRQQLFRK